MSDREQFFKVLNDTGGDYYDDRIQWLLPQGDQPGPWMPPTTNLSYHLFRPQGLLRQLGPNIWLAEERGERFYSRDGIITGEARLVRRLTTWTEQTARLFACDCAEMALLPAGPTRLLCKQSLAVARCYAVGNATSQELSEARLAIWNTPEPDRLGDATRATCHPVAWSAARNAAMAARRQAAYRLQIEARLGKITLEATMSAQTAMLLQWLFPHSEET